MWSIIPKRTFWKFWLRTTIRKKLNDVISFNNSINNNKDMITYFKDKNNKSKKRYKKFKTLTTLSKSFDTFVFVSRTSISITLSLTGIGLIAIPKSSGIACGSTISNKVKYEIVMQNILNTKNNMKKINNYLNLSVNYTKNLHKTM